jgi:hypothetical protein
MTVTEPVIPKRVILSMGDKGGVGKTNVMTGLAEWFEHHQIPVTMLDLDTENKTRGSLTHFFGGAVPKINIHTPEGLDAFLDYLDAGPPILLADMASGAGRVTHTWFDQMYAPVAARGIAFTAVGVVTSDPASVESVLTWADRLQRRVAYVIVENETDANAPFTYWRASAQPLAFQQTFTPAVRTRNPRAVRRDDTDVDLPAASPIRTDCDAHRQLLLWRWRALLVQPV